MSNPPLPPAYQITLESSDPSAVLSQLQASREEIVGAGLPVYLKCDPSARIDPIVALLESWNYEAIARVLLGSLVCFAERKSVVFREPPPLPQLGRTSSISQTLQISWNWGTFAIRESRSFRTLRSLGFDLSGWRPRSLRTRKLKKLVVDPERFLVDASSSILSVVGLRAFRAVDTKLSKLRPSSSSSSSSSKSRDLSTRKSRKQVSVYDSPKRTLIIFFGHSTLGLERLSACTEGLTLRTEVIVLLSGAHDGLAAQALSTLRCPRARVYAVRDTGAQDLLRYGLARSYASNIGVLALSDSTIEIISESEIGATFALLTRSLDHVWEPTLGLVAARREAWRDFLSKERWDEDLQKGMDWVLQEVSGGRPGGNPSVFGGSDTRGSDTREPPFCQYPGVDPLHPFTGSDAGPGAVVCCEREPEWPAADSSEVTKDAGTEALISVIMTVYNAENTVAAAIDSVLRQTHGTLELLVVDDCSTDGSLRVLLACAREDSRVRVFQTARNRGTYYAKNIGLYFARGVFVTFHDSDDVSSLCRLAWQARALESEPKAIGNYTRYQRLSEEGEEVWLNGRSNRPGYITLMVRRKEAMAVVGFFDSVRVSADAEYVDRLKIATGRSVRLLPMVSYFALQAEGSLTTSGVAAFGVDASGRSSMPPVRQQYQDAARRWHERIYEEESCGEMPFPLGVRPFGAPAEILPDRGSRDCAEIENDSESSPPLSPVGDGDFRDKEL